MHVLRSKVSKLKETYAVHVLLVVVFCPQNQYGKIEEKYPFDVII